MELVLQPKRVALVMLACVAVLTVIHSVVLFFYFYLDDKEVYGLVDFFDFDTECNVPTMYSAAAMLFCSALLAVVARIAKRNGDHDSVYWTALAVIFCFLAIDEATVVHELLSDKLEQYIEPQGFYYFLWILPYGIATLILGLSLLRFLLRLPKPTRNLCLASAALFLAGALGLEALSAREADLNSTTTVTYCLLYTFEELFEMLAVVLFAYAIMRHIVALTGRLALVLDADGEAVREASE